MRTHTSVAEAWFEATSETSRRYCSSPPGRTAVEFRHVSAPAGLTSTPSESFVPGALHAVRAVLSLPPHPATASPAATTHRPVMLPARTDISRSGFRPGEARKRRVFARLPALCGDQIAKRAHLTSLAVEVLGREPLLVRGTQRRPLVVCDREPGGVAVAALHHLVLAKHTLEAKAEALRRPARRLVERVALPLEAPVAELVERLARKQEDRLGGGGATAKLRAEPDVADLDRAVVGRDAEIRRDARGLALRQQLDREE